MSGDALDELPAGTRTVAPVFFFFCGDGGFGSRFLLVIANLGYLLGCRYLR